MQSASDKQSVIVEEKEAATQRKEAKVQEKTEKEAAKDAKKAADDSRSPLQKIISIVEVGALLALLSVFRKPLETVGTKVLKDIAAEAITIADTLTQDFINAELALRSVIVTNYLLDPVLCYKIGPQLYQQLVVNANWHKQIYTKYDPIPASVDAVFTIGTGSGAVSAGPELCKGISLQILALCEYLILSGQTF